MSNDDGDIFWIECASEWPKSFVGFVRMFSDKTATTMKITTLLVHPVHVVKCPFPLLVGCELEEWTYTTWTSSYAYETAEKSRASRIIGRNQDLY